MIRAIIDRFRALPAATEPLTDENEINRNYRYWRIRILYSCFIGYAVFYFCRVNISMAIPRMQESLGCSKAELGLIVSALQIMYGIGKFGNGVLADRANPRYFMALGLLFSAWINFSFGLTASLFSMALLWGLNGWFQSMGFPAGARLLSHWFSPSEYGRIWGIYGCSHQVGTALILVASGYFVRFGWQYAFYLPALFGIGISFFLLNRLRDVPSTLGLPPVELYRGDVTDQRILKTLDKEVSVKESLFELILNNRFVWFIAFGNFFLYVARYGALIWAPAFIKETKGLALTQAGWMMALFEISGILGMLSAGWISDHLFAARRGPIMSVYMTLLSLGLITFWVLPSDYPLLCSLALSLCGFLVYGPLMLVSVAVAGFAGKKAAATASGFTGLWGYLGAVVSGAGAGWIIDRHGWDGGFAMFTLAALLSAFFFALTWNVLPRGLPDEKRTALTEPAASAEAAPAGK
jgi:glycerol-3-phosphate transporter